MADPIGISVALDAGPLDADPEWTRLDDEDNLVAACRIRRGRADEFDRTGTGTATIFLNDANGVYDPAGGFELVTKQAAIALHNPVDDSWATIFRGDIDTVDANLAPSQNVNFLTLECVDKLDFFANYEGRINVTGTWTPPFTGAWDPGNFQYAETVGTVDDRINQVLDEVGWPDPDLRSVFTGNVRLAETIYANGTSMLTVIDEACDAEFPGIANRFIGRDGTFVFHGRLARFDYTNPDYEITKYLAGDGLAIQENPGDYAQIRGIAYGKSRDKIINSSLITHQDATDDEIIDMQIEDATSITNYGVRSFSAENLRILESVLTGFDAKDECKLFSNYYVSTYKDPATRVRQIVFKSLHPDDPRAAKTWNLIQNVEISDVIQLAVSSVGGAGFFDDLYFVEGISYEINPLQPDFQDVTLTLDVSPSSWFVFDWEA